ncbi:hypothetical protein [Nocardia carnea]|nr:hypothetical protein [Nocardia carnea]
MTSLPIKQIKHTLRHSLRTWPTNLQDEDFPDLAEHIRRIHGTASDADFQPPDFDVASEYQKVNFGLSTASGRESPYERLPLKHRASVGSIAATGFKVRKLPIEGLVATVSELEDFMPDKFAVGFPSAPFMLVLAVNNPAAFSRYINDARNSTIRVDLKYHHRRHDGWSASRYGEFIPVDENAGFRLSFTLPTMLAEWMSNGQVPTWSPRQDRYTLFSSIAVVRGGRVVRLLYKPQHTG